MFGRYYVLEHVFTEYKHKREELKFREYICDIAKVMAESWNCTISCRYSELIQPHKEEPQSGDEVALEVIKKCGLKVA